MDPGESALEGAPPTRRFERGRARRQRCFCTRCGAHAIAMVGWATISGFCGVCGSSELVPLEVEEPRERAGAAASPEPAGTAASPQRAGAAVRAAAGL